MSWQRWDNRTWLPVLVSLTESVGLRPLTRWVCQQFAPHLLLDQAD